MYPSQMEHFGNVYRKSIFEAMGSTGVIRPEFWGALDKLQDRLGASEESSKEIFLQHLLQCRKKDVGEDLFQTGKGATAHYFLTPATLA